MKKKLLAVALLTMASLLHAESNPAKKELVTKLLQLQQAAVDGMARQLTDQAPGQMLQQAGTAIQFRVAPEKREALAKDIQAEVKKYQDDIGPLLRERAAKLAPTTIGNMLDERFTEDELRQLIAFMESPVQRKYAQLGSEMTKSLGEKLVADTKGQVAPKLKALEQAIATRLNAAVQASGNK